MLTIDSCSVQHGYGVRSLGQSDVRRARLHRVLAACLLLLFLLCSLEKQVAFSTALMLDWCGATPVGTAQQVLQQLLDG